MKKIVSYSICVMAALFTFASCVDLNLNPLSEGSSDNWYSSKEEIEMSVNDFYRTDFFPIQGVLWADDIVRRNDTYNPFSGSITAENGTVKTRWENYYKGIARALRILANMDKARELGIVRFTTTLASSRWKSLEQINEAGLWAASQVDGVEFWDRNWRKGGLQQRRNELLKQNGFYNQLYCGCEFSMSALREREARAAAKSE